MPKISRLLGALSMGLVALGTAGRVSAQCPQAGGAGGAGAGPQNRVGVVAAHDPLCPQDLPCGGTRDALIYLKLPSIQSIGGRSPHAEYSADGLNSFLTIFHSAAAKGVENATIRAFNAARACPDGKACDQEAPGAAAGGQVPLAGDAAGQEGPLELAPAGPPAAAGGAQQPAGAGAAGGGQPAAPAAAATSPVVQPIRVDAVVIPPTLPPDRLPAPPVAAPPAPAPPAPAPPAAAPPAPGAGAATSIPAPAPAETIPQPTF